MEQTIKLTLTDTTSEAPNKNNIAIAKKINKIERLKKQIQTINSTLTQIKGLYDKNLSLTEKKLFKVKEALIVRLYERFLQKSFTAWQKEMIYSKIQNEIFFLQENQYTSEKFENILNELQKQAKEDIKNMDPLEKEFMDEIMGNMLKDWGFDFEDGTVDYDKLDDEDYQREFFKKQQESRQDWEREVKREQKANQNLTTDKEFYKLYKSLVKKTHPDLVTDKKEKERLEVVMKELSLAWEDRNYYKLLLLQKEIIKEEDLQIQLSKNQLKSVFTSLDREIEKLEIEKYKLKQAPENEFYWNHFNARSQKGIEKKLAVHKNEMLALISNHNFELQQLKNQKSTKEMLKEIRSVVQYSDPFELY
ncbi:hypothetical protein NBT05_02070 [Aquimarina sp. ERC-38]|uniref:hypothetical protein n=1 Tax=Aquimarina sp. ERC-38 TaxID=2949996 RepID=UPI002247BDAE|nr:hypothetical protein [Aquimarina sp. ERC-38]UZO81272.1 hypothetical protein NBT05_02070 [Aquimarina sp. ERC-38]